MLSIKEKDMFVSMLSSKLALRDLRESYFKSKENAIKDLMSNSYVKKVNIIDGDLYITFKDNSMVVVRWLRDRNGNRKNDDYSIEYFENNRIKKIYKKFK
jgi:hypothetical protein